MVGSPGIVTSVPSKMGLNGYDLSLHGSCRTQGDQFTNRLGLQGIATTG